jgi:formamidopyrimidine-DNA glycosylase
MPELPEIESLRRSLDRALVGARVVGSGVLRADMLHRAPGAPSRPLRPGATIARLHRQGKQLVIETADGECLLMHLGMSGSLRVLRQPKPETHVHAEWTLERSGRSFLFRYRDPRRFGWLELHGSMESVRRLAWSRLGPDALDPDVAQLAEAMRSSTRPVKALLLDQGVIAGLGNIYVDEALFRARIHPLRRSNRVHGPDLGRLVRCVRSTLREAVELGGSTIRDHRTAEGGWGSFQERHAVYGRAGLPCRRCRTPLRSVRVQQRMTVFCERCQTR